MSHACGNPRCHGLRCESAEPSYDQATEKERATDMTTHSCAGSISELWRDVLTIDTSRTNSCSNNPPHSHHEDLHRTLDPQTQLVQWSLGLDPYSSMLQKPKRQTALERLLQLSTTNRRTCWEVFELDTCNGIQTWGKFVENTVDPVLRRDHALQPEVAVIKNLPKRCRGWCRPVIIIYQYGHIFLGGAVHWAGTSKIQWKGALFAVVSYGMTQLVRLPKKIVEMSTKILNHEMHQQKHLFRGHFTSLWWWCSTMSWLFS